MILDLARPSKCLTLFAGGIICLVIMVLSGCSPLNREGKEVRDHLIRSIEMQQTRQTAEKL